MKKWTYFNTSFFSFTSSECTKKDVPHQIETTHMSFALGAPMQKKTTPCPVSLAWLNTAWRRAPVKNFHPFFGSKLASWTWTMRQVAEWYTSTHWHYIAQFPYDRLWWKLWWKRWKETTGTSLKELNTAWDVRNQHLSHIWKTPPACGSILWL